MTRRGPCRSGRAEGRRGCPPPGCGRGRPTRIRRTAKSLLRAVAVGVLKDVYDAGSGFEDGCVLGTAWDVVGLARFIGRLLALYGQVEQAAHDYAPLRAVVVGRDLEPLRGP